MTNRRRIVWVALPVLLVPFFRGPIASAEFLIWLVLFAVWLWALFVWSRPDRSRTTTA